MTVYRTIDGDVLDAICLQHYGETGHEIAVLRANPGLAARGTVLGAGIEVILPTVVPAPDQGTLRLWGRTQ